MIRGVDISLFYSSWWTDLEFEWMINLEDLNLVIMFIARSVAVNSAQ